MKRDDTGGAPAIVLPFSEEPEAGELDSQLGSQPAISSGGIPGSAEQSLIHLEEAGTLLEKATFEEAREILNTAEACRIYAKRARLALGIQNRCAEIRLRSERRLGIILATMDRRQRGEYARENQTSRGETFGPSLQELGISRSQSSRWQRIARIPEALFDAHLGKAQLENRELTSAGVEKLARLIESHDSASRSPCTSSDGATALNLCDLLETGTRFGCIYADPPWAYSNQGTRGATKNHYESMALDEIASLPVAELALPNSHLHLWTTNAFLFEAEYIMQSWGFEYKSVFVWVKPTMGLGNYWRCAHEFMLLGLRGSAPFRSKGLRSWVREPRGAHSEKPEVVRSLIEQASPGPYLELFARRTSPGWTVWGDQVA